MWLRGLTRPKTVTKKTLVVISFWIIMFSFWSLVPSANMHCISMNNWTSKTGFRQRRKYDLLYGRNIVLGPHFDCFARWQGHEHGLVFVYFFCASRGSWGSLGSLGRGGGRLRHLWYRLGDPWSPPCGSLGHLGTPWGLLNDYLVTTWWLLGDYMVTT